MPAAAVQCTASPVSCSSGLNCECEGHRTKRAQKREATSKETSGQALHLRIWRLLIRGYVGALVQLCQPILQTLDAGHAVFCSAAAVASGVAKSANIHVVSAASLRDGLTLRRAAAAAAARLVQHASDQLLLPAFEQLQRWQACACRRLLLRWRRRPQIH